MTRRGALMACRLRRRNDARRKEAVDIIGRRHLHHRRNGVEAISGSLCENRRSRLYGRHIVPGLLVRAASIGNWYQGIAAGSLNGVAGVAAFAADMNTELKLEESRNF